MRRQPSLRSQLNQIRLWVRQGRTDAWIAHKLDIGIDELTRFKREHQLDDDDTSRLRPADPLSVPPPEPAAEEPEDEDEEEDEADAAEDSDRAPRRARETSRRRSSGSRSSRRREPRADRDDDERAASPAKVEHDTEGDEEATDGEPRRRRRRGRRGGRRHRARRNAFEATFDHGGEGYGLWLDPAVVDNPVYSEHWAGHRAVTVTVEADAITIRRAGSDQAAQSDEPEEPEDDY